MSEWREYRLSDIINIIGGGTPKTTVAEYWNGDIPWLSVVDYNNERRYVFATEKAITEKGLKESSTKILKKGQIIISARGTVGALAQLGCDMAFNQSCYGITSKPETINDYLYYLLHQCIADLKQQSNGGVFDTIIRETFDNIHVIIPSLYEQQAIAEVLSSLDDKIDLLSRQNKTLEALASTYFRQWFIEQASDDWEEIKITSLFEVKDGTHDSPKQKVEGKKLITSRHISEYTLDFQNAYYISDEDFLNINKRSKVEQFDILFSMIGTIGLTYMEASNKIDYAIKNIGLFKTSQNKEWKYYTYLWLKSDLAEQFLRGQVAGSTQEYITLGSLRNITFAKPPNLKEFNQKVGVLFEKVFNNTKQIQTLKKLRDTLLPKLISGEVRVSM